MKNQFKRIKEELLPPPEIKRAVIDEIYTYQLLSDMMQLFTGDFMRAELDMFNIPQAAKRKDKEKD